jgi:hypothetical protein
VVPRKSAQPITFALGVMGIELPPQHLDLYRAIDEILWRNWDPIGVSGMDGARDEYQAYLPEVYRLALAGDRARIADYLFEVATGRMGLTTQRNQHLAVADKILAAKDRAGVD